jgi:hypothetical protein
MLLLQLAALTVAASAGAADTITAAKAATSTAGTAIFLATCGGGCRFDKGNQGAGCKRDRAVLPDPHPPSHVGLPGRPSQRVPGPADCPDVLTSTRGAAWAEQRTAWRVATRVATAGF